ncbi:Rho termination factor N-terminal domain-containing protein [Spirillospora sp. NPDC029432]|uniref:Rho termination factor N-terminal domain-containing protein n=1 Tax=Spirillospora sp. NPDC029432 TaxID=3154599 RepID=UPI0034514A0F
MAALRKVPSALARPGRAVRDAWARASDTAARRHGTRPRAFQVAFTLVRDRTGALRGTKDDTAPRAHDASPAVPDRPAPDLPRPDEAARDGAGTSSAAERDEAALKSEAREPKQAEPDPAAPAAPAEAAAPVGGGAVEEAGGTGPVAEASMASMSRQALYRMAQELDIPGRSRMTKAELAEAIRQTSRSTPPAK